MGAQAQFFFFSSLNTLQPAHIFVSMCEIAPEMEPELGTDPKVESDATSNQIPSVYAARLEEIKQMKEKRRQVSEMCKQKLATDPHAYKECEAGDESGQEPSPRIPTPHLKPKDPDSNAKGWFQPISFLRCIVGCSCTQ